MLLKGLISMLLGIGTVVLADGMVAIDIKPPNFKGDLEHIKILDQKELIFDKISGKKFCEASDLAYDDANGTLYMINDEGILYLFDIQLGEKIESLKPRYAKRLRFSNGDKLKGQYRDSEGLDMDESGSLIVSFEKIPRVELYDKNAKNSKAIHLPQSINYIENYRGENKALESVLNHSKYGILTAPERPLKGFKSNQMRIYASSGKKWDYLSSKIKHNSITAIEELEDGNLLILERAKSGALSPITITLRKLYLDKRIGTRYQSKVLAMLSSKSGWRVENFEGLTRVGKNRYLMISDGGDDAFKKSLLLYFEVAD